MRRWNGWGFEDVEARLGPSGRRYVEARVGAATPARPATLPDVVASVPPSRLAPAPGLDLDPEARVRHARGQSLPDLLDLHAGRLDAVPDAVATPADGSAVRALIERARSASARLIPYGGGTSVVGGVTTRPSPDPVIVVDLGLLSGVRSLDERSGLVTVGAGTTGPALAERRLSSRARHIVPLITEASPPSAWVG